jgi:outer membrane receptor for ferrienterochelin and colicins
LPIYYHIEPTKRHNPSIFALGKPCQFHMDLSYRYSISYFLIVAWLFSATTLLAQSDSLSLTSKRHPSIPIDSFVVKSPGDPLTLPYSNPTDTSKMDDVVITGTLKAVKLSESPVHVDIYTQKFFNQNPTPSLFDALTLASGIRPQVNCNVCATGDIHINGMEGPYTMILIDGMPIVSSLASVYGLMGIPNALIERVEIVKGPASSLYGSEAMGGLINVILKKSQKQRAHLDFWTNSWGESQLDLGFQHAIGKQWTVLTGINIFHFGSLKDYNKDGFTDIPLQQRISIFQQYKKERTSGKRLDMAWRGFIEDRWGGQLHYKPKFRGGDSVYGESIQTQRLEFLNTYEPWTQYPITWQNSAVWHRQQSAYGTMTFNAEELRLFTQALWQKRLKKHDLLMGMAYRFTYYDDNTVVTERIQSDSSKIPKPLINSLPAIFFQDEFQWNAHKWLVGYRADYHQEHGLIQSFRGAWKWDRATWGQWRLNVGTGFRTVNIFTEEHAALTGARKIILEGQLKPEESRNLNISWNHTLPFKRHGFLQLDVHAFRTQFTQRILPDYNRSFDAIYYSNSDEGALNQGITLNAFWQTPWGLSFRSGVTFIDATIQRNSQSTPERPFHTERFNGNFAVQWISFDKRWEYHYTGNFVGPMKLPLASEFDPRPDASPWWSIQNINIRFNPSKGYSFFVAVQNIWDWTPARNAFLLSRSHDPFDKNVRFDAHGNVIQNSENPYGMTFDASYVYAPNQGRRFQLGISLAF